MPAGRAGVMAKPETAVPLPTLPEAILALSPVGYWKLDETSGTTAIDYSGNARDGTYSGAVTLADTLGPDGIMYPTWAAGGRVTIPHNVAWSQTGIGLTLFIVSKPTTVSNGRFLMEKGIDGVKEWIWNQRFVVSGGSIETQLATMRPTSGGSAVKTSYPTNGGGLVPAVWNVNAGTMFGTTSAGVFQHFRGSSVAMQKTDTVITGSVTNAAGLLYIGDDPSTSPTNTFIGQICHVAVYQGVLTRTQIKSIMDAAARDGWIDATYDDQEVVQPVTYGLSSVADNEVVDLSLMDVVETEAITYDLASVADNEVIDLSLTDVAESEAITYTLSINTATPTIFQYANPIIVGSTFTERSSIMTAAQSVHASTLIGDLLVFYGCQNTGGFAPACTTGWSANLLSLSQAGILSSAVQCKIATQNGDHVDNRPTWSNNTSSGSFGIVLTVRGPTAVTNGGYLAIAGQSGTVDGGTTITLPIITVPVPSVVLALFAQNDDTGAATPTMTGGFSLAGTGNGLSGSDGRLTVFAGTVVSRTSTTVVMTEGSAGDAKQVGYIAFTLPPI